MNVLFLCGSADLDFLQDAVFQGLVQLLGQAQVRDHPVGYSYHGPPPPGTPFAPFYFDLPTPEPLELDELIDDADAIVIGSVRPSVLPSVRALLARPRRPPTAFLDGEDDPYVRGVVEYVDLYFKAEVLRSARMGDGVGLRRWLRSFTAAERHGDPLRRLRGVAVAGGRAIPLPFAFVPAPWQRPKRRPTQDTAFLASPVTRQRADIIRGLEAMRGDGYVVATPSGGHLPWAAYMDELARTSVSLAVRGRGRNTLRYWEIPFAGSLLLSEPTGIVIENDFADGVDAAFAPAERLVARARELLRDRDRIEEMAAAGHDRVCAHHLGVHRAERVLERLASVRGSQLRVLT